MPYQVYESLFCRQFECRLQKTTSVDNIMLKTCNIKVWKEVITITFQRHQLTEVSVKLENCDNPILYFRRVSWAGYSLCVCLYHLCTGLKCIQNFIFFFFSKIMMTLIWSSFVFGSELHSKSTSCSFHAAARDWSQVLNSHCCGTPTHPNQYWLKKGANAKPSN